MSIEQVVCPECHGRGGYTRGPYPATKCNYCNGKGYIVQEAAKSNPPAGGEGKPEPVAWMIHRVDSTGDRTGTVLTALSADHAEVYRKQGHDVVPLYTAPLSRSGDSALVEAPGNYQAQAVLDERLTVVDVSEEMNLAADLDDCRASLNREAGARVLADNALAEAIALLKRAAYGGPNVTLAEFDKFIQQHGERK